MANLQMGAKFLYLMGSGLQYQDHSISKLQSKPFCCQYSSSCSLIPTDVPPEIHVISHIYPTTCLKYPLAMIYFRLSDTRQEICLSTCLPAVCRSGGHARASGEAGGCGSTETDIYTHKEEIAATHQAWLGAAEIDNDRPRELSESLPSPVVTNVIFFLHGFCMFVHHE